MEYSFTNGTAEQKALWREAVDHLLNLPVDDIPVKVAVTFEPPEDLVGRGHTDLALTTFTYGSIDAETEVRNDAPDFGDQRASLEALAASMGLEYSVTKHFHETAIHELGHALFAALPEEDRTLVAQMFGAKSDSVAELFPGAKAWEDRIGEAIAETFKEAFLPRRYRVFPNRTNIRIPYSRFAEFRAHFRSYETEAGGGGEGGAWKPYPRADAARMGYEDEHSKVFTDLLQAPFLGIGVRDPFVWEGLREPGGESKDPKESAWIATGFAKWFGTLDDLIEMRHGYTTPALSFFTPTENWATGFQDETPVTSGPGWKGLGWRSWGGQVFCTVIDEAGKGFSVSGIISVTAYIEGRFGEHPAPVLKWWLGMERDPFFHDPEEASEKLWGSGVIGQELMEGFNFTAREIFEWAEVHDPLHRTPEWGKATHYEIETAVQYGMGIQLTTTTYPARPHLDRTFVEENFPELWGKPYEFVEGAEEGIKVDVELPSGLLVPSSAASGRHGLLRPISGTIA